jgi:hypothetical protein
VIASQRSVSTDGDGLTVNLFSYANVATDPPTHFDISYTKADSALSVAQNTLVAASGSGSTGSGFPAITWLAFGLAGALAIALVFMFVPRGRRRRPAPVHPRQPRPLTAAQRASLRTGAAKSDNLKPDGGKNFCTECGSKVEGSPKFCPECGAKL